MNWDFVKICEDVKSKQGQLLSILTKIRYSHGQQSLLVGKCLRENHRQIKSCLPHLPANRKKSGDFAESRKQVTSSCFKWQKRPQYTRTQASPSPRGLLGSKWQTIKHCVKSFLSCESNPFQSQVSKALICPANFNVASCFEMCHPSKRDNLLSLVVLCPHLEREIKHFDSTLCKVPSLNQGSPLQEMADDRCISKTFHRRTLNILNRYLLLTLHFHKTEVQLLVCCATSAHHP